MIDLKSMQDYTRRTAQSIIADKRLCPDTTLPLIICEIEPQLLPALQARLLEFYDDSALTALFEGGSEAIIPATGLLTKSKFGFADLLRIMDMLCGENGCEWDKVQTHMSIRKNILEEAAEAVEAIDEGNLAHMCEEFGDLLLQPVFQATIAEREGEFGVTDMLSALCRKLITRHTHVFGGQKAATPEEALAAWKAAKAAERGGE